MTENTRFSTPFEGKTSGRNEGGCDDEVIDIPNPLEKRTTMSTATAGEGLSVARPFDPAVVDAARRESGWTESRLAYLKHLYTGLAWSAAAIAYEFGVTRNAIVGKVHRLGLPSRKATIFLIRGGHYKVNRSKRRVSKPAESGANARTGFAPWRMVPAAAVAAPIEQPPSLGRTVATLANGECKWPYGDRGNFTFCGQPQREDEVYCPHHCGVAYIGRPKPRTDPRMFASR